MTANDHAEDSFHLDHMRKQSHIYSQIICTVGGNDFRCSVKLICYADVAYAVIAQRG